jgi:hypothetical protein
MSAFPDEQQSVRSCRRSKASEIEAVADEFIALVEEFQAALSEGHFPPAFEQRLAQVRRDAQRLIEP